MPGIATRVGLVEHLAPTVECRVMNSVAVDGVCRRRAQALVLEGALTEVEHHKDTAQMQVPGIELGAVTLLEAFDIDGGDVIYQIDLPSTQGCQADGVLFFGLADDLV